MSFGGHIEVGETKQGRALQVTKGMLAGTHSFQHQGMPSAFSRDLSVVESASVLFLPGRFTFSDKRIGGEGNETHHCSWRAGLFLLEWEDLGMKLVFFSALKCSSD